MHETPIGPLRLVAASRQRLVLGAELASFVASSPDRTLYHSDAYVAFACAERPLGGMLVGVAVGDALRFVIPVYPESDRAWTTGYSGVLMPPSDKAFRRALGDLRAWLGANGDLRASVTQAVLSAGGVDRDRRVLVDLALTEGGVPGSAAALFTRVLAPCEEGALLGSYDGDLRNQIRQASRNGLRTEIALDVGATNEAARAFYARYESIHAESWERTGMVPHPIDYWLRLSRAVRDAGGVDLGVLVHDGASPAAGVTCHVLGAHAIYWSGGSTAEGQARRANPLALHTAIAKCHALGVTSFELGRFRADEADKARRITRYKAQFGGSLVRVPNLTPVQPTLPARALALAQRIVDRAQRWRSAIA